MAIKMERTSLRCDKRDYEFYKSLTSANTRNPLEVPFGTMGEAFVAFACLGYHHDRYIALAQPEELTLSVYLDQDLDLYVLGALAYARLRAAEPATSAEETVAELTTAKTIIPLVEGWANGGVQVYREATEAGVTHPTLELYSMLEEAQAQVSMRSDQV